MTAGSPHDAVAAAFAVLALWAAVHSTSRDGSQPHSTALALRLTCKVLRATHDSAASRLSLPEPSAVAGAAACLDCLLARGCRATRLSTSAAPR
jgi:hypothetical protein